MAEPHDIGEGVLVEPTASDYKLLAKIADMSDRPAKLLMPSLKKARRTSNSELGVVDIGP